MNIYIYIYIYRKPKGEGMNSTAKSFCLVVACAQAV